MANVWNIYQEIGNRLDNLVTAGTINQVIRLSGVENNNEVNIANYPVAIYEPPNIESTPELQKTNMREHIFEIEIYEKAENIQGPEDVCDLQQNILDDFDDNITLGGALDLGLEPALTQAMPVQQAGNKLIFFRLIINARASNHSNF